MSRTPVGIWLLMRTVIVVVRPGTLSIVASSPRGSIGTGARRWLTRSSATTCAALRERGVALRRVAVAHLGGDVVGGVGPHQRRAGGTAARPSVTAGSSS